MHHKSNLVSLAIAALLAACASPAPQAAGPEITGTTASTLHVPTLPLARASLLAADAATSNDASLRGTAGFLAHFADDASFLARRVSLLTGKPAIADWLAKNPLGGTLGWRYVRGDVSALGDLGYTVGWLEIVGPQDAQGNATVQWAIYAATWEQREGEWRITAFAKVDLTGPPAAAPSGLLPLASDGPVYPSFEGPAVTAKTLMETDTTFAALTQKVGRQKGFDAYVDENAIAIDDPLVLGRAAIFASNAGGNPAAVLEWGPVLARAARSGDLGFTIGSYVSKVPAADGTVTPRYGKYLTVWKRTADGSFKWVLDGGNSSPAPAPTG